MTIGKAVMVGAAKGASNVAHTQNLKEVTVYPTLKKKARLPVVYVVVVGLA